MTIAFDHSAECTDEMIKSIQPRTFLALALAAALSPAANAQSNTSMSYSVTQTNVACQLNDHTISIGTSDAQLITAIDELYTYVSASTVELEQEFRDALAYQLSDLYA